jgi:ankyrin repeat protein
MSLLLLPTELVHGIATCLPSNDVFALMQTCRQLNRCAVRPLCQIAIRFKRDNGNTLTQGLQDVSFWFDGRGDGSVLEWAAINNYMSTYNRLLAEPAMDLQQTDCYGLTLLHRLSGQGLVVFMQPLIQTLEERGTLPFQTDRSCLTPLHYAAGRGKVEAVELLLRTGADVAARDHVGNTPLHLAAVTGSHEVFEALINAGADIAAEASFGWMPIDLASITRRDSAVAQLKKLGARAPT